MAKITFKRLKPHEFVVFRDDVRNIFSIAVIETYDNINNVDEVISCEDIDESLYDEQNETYFIYANDEKVGGACLKIDDQTHENSMELFFVYPEKHGNGLGQEIWKAIENRYPATKVWRLITPYFEKRNIHFYVNKCGFKIVEFFNKKHRDPNRPVLNSEFHDDYFIFEKIIAH